MVGEVRDPEVALIVGQAAFTGHLVLSTLHTADSASAIARLINLGLEPFKLADIVTLVVAQRLVRKLCVDCRVVHTDIEARRLGEANGVRAIGASRGEGCKACRSSGYVGRSPIVELLIPDDRMREEIARGARTTELRANLRHAGVRTMRDAGLDLVAQGVTTLEEVDRVAPAPALAEPFREASDSGRVLNYARVSPH
jgi:type II secretory ATPase GspE/PulE/Tfp pilus assembly ATPase PilB-like protein